GIENVLAYVEKSWGYENRYDKDEHEDRVKNCFKFSKGLLINSSRWLKEVKKWSLKLNAQEEVFEDSLNNGTIRIVLHYTRLSLMLADHFYSSQDMDSSWQDVTGLYANTDPKTKKLKQKLDEHIIGVQKSALKIAHSLTKFEHEPPRAENIKRLLKMSPKAYVWQDKAVKELKENYSPKCGFFAVNMASTGCGKTFANAKIMQAVSDNQKSLRYILALGLRTLTLQTGDEYRDKIGLSSKELAVLIGSKAVLNLHNDKSRDGDIQEAVFSGSESLESLFNLYILKLLSNQFFF
ncbi:MAG: type I-F CRISPR-associated helicase Cas3, partial [Campylobacterota bacterium]|nr:type I-F CRISPR-associated helicase Cas3 [Campylobacterota bacterium]